MFGLPNIRGSCWVNAALQGVFACPSLKDHTIDDANPIDVSLTEVYKTQAKSGLKDLFDSIQSTYIPAGRDIGDSHELIVHLADKLPWLDKLMRFKIANQITCKTCGNKTLKEDTAIEITLTPSVRNMPILNALQEFIKPIEIDGWDCDKCKEKRTCVTQTLFGSFPQILMIHRSSIGTSMEYSSILILNKRKYALFGVICFNGGHWWTYARDLPPGNPWYELDDSRVTKMTPTQFPVAGTMRILLYFLLEN